MHDRIIESRFYDELQRYPSNYVTVEVACALEGIAHAYSMCTDQRKDTYRKAIIAASQYLLNVQWKTGKFAGGFGNSTEHSTQRIDVTGHVVNSFITVLQTLGDVSEVKSGKTTEVANAEVLENK